MPPLDRPSESQAGAFKEKVDVASVIVDGRAKGGGALTV